MLHFDQMMDNVCLITVVLTPLYLLYQLGTFLIS